MLFALVYCELTAKSFIALPQVQQVGKALSKVLQRNGISPQVDPKEYTDCLKLHGLECQLIPESLSQIEASVYHTINALMDQLDQRMDKQLGKRGFEFLEGLKWDRVAITAFGAVAYGFMLVVGSMSLAGAVPWLPAGLGIAFFVVTVTGFATSACCLSIMRAQCCELDLALCSIWFYGN